MEKFKAFRDTDCLMLTVDGTRLTWIVDAVSIKDDILTIKYHYNDKDDTGTGKITCTRKGLHYIGKFSDKNSDGEKQEGTVKLKRYDNEKGMALVGEYSFKDEDGSGSGEIMLPCTRVAGNLPNQVPDRETSIISGVLVCGEGDGMEKARWKPSGFLSGGVLSLRYSYLDDANSNGKANLYLKNGIYEGGYIENYKRSQESGTMKMEEYWNKKGGVLVGTWESEHGNDGPLYVQCAVLKGGYK